ncbi:LuxR family transcriptional regulator [Streptomyces sp. PTM05]|uniref:LuxR family transcriptional regulator n=1 Tax=Streptantibioticus parmotrematis TaxID=2873249 RepID=A0ABS7QWA1_9ACTN|nr:LuxR family transcriptional regulator [Streptantibioticus parmotrematis]
MAASTKTSRPAGAEPVAVGRRRVETVVERRAPLIGRDREVAVVAEALRPAPTARTVLVTGPAGAGKTAVLDEARQTAAREGTKILRMTWEDTAEPAGPAALADAVNAVLAKVHDGRLPARVTAVRRARLRLDDDRSGELPLLSVLGETLADAAHHVPFALVLDDVDRIPAPTASALRLMLRVFRPVGLPVVLAGRPTRACAADTPDLATAADHVLDLAPLPPDDVGGLVAQRLGRPPEPLLVAAVRRCLGPLAGRPAAVLSVLTAAREDGRLLDLDGRVGLTGAEEDLRLGTDAASLCPVTADATDTATVLARLLHRADLRVEDLHALAGPGRSPGADLGRAVDRLVEERVVTADGDGRLSFAVPALAAALRAGPTGHDPRPVHAAVVTAVTRRLAPADAGASHPSLADHVVAAGTALDDTVAVPLLLAAARRDARAHHPRAARAYLSALGRLSPDDPAAPRALCAAARLGLERGDHRGVLALGGPLLAALRRTAPEAADERLEFATTAWALSALHEHRPPCEATPADVLDEALRRTPRAAMLTALGGRYGIGPLAPWPPNSHPAATGGRSREPGGGPLPSYAELRTLAVATGRRDGLARALRGLPVEAAWEVAVGPLRDAAAYGDLAGALEAVLGERHLSAGHSRADRYHTMVRDYLAGNWDAALTAARDIEARGRADESPVGGWLPRALAAEIHCFRGDLARAREWLDRIPGTAVHPLIARARLGVRYWSGQQETALREAWRDVRRAREGGLLAGLDRVLLRILEFAEEARPQQARQALEELAALHQEMATATTREALSVARGVVHRDAGAAYDAHRSAERRGDRHMQLYCCLVLSEVGDDPQHWLAEAARHTHRMALGRPGRLLLSRSARRHNVPMPRGRSARQGLNEAEVRLITMVSEGATNRQIAARLACSEKTVEQRLTRLFQRTGRRSRVELAAAWLDGSLAGLGRVPDLPPDGTHTPGRRSTASGG